MSDFPAIDFLEASCQMTNSPYDRPEPFIFVTRSEYHGLPFHIVVKEVGDARIQLTVLSGFVPSGTTQRRRALNYINTLNEHGEHGTYVLMTSGLAYRMWWIGSAEQANAALDVAIEAILWTLPGYIDALSGHRSPRSAHRLTTLGRGVHGTA